MATTSTERQRKRRARLKADGFVDVTVTVPKDKAAAVRRFAHNVAGAEGAAFEPSRLFLVLRALKENREKLEAVGVTHAGVFGSTARGDYRPDSDVDVLMETDPKIVVDILDQIRAAGEIKDLLEDLIPEVAIDVADRAGLKPGLRSTIESDAVYAY